jgi:hypothetical protein
MAMDRKVVEAKIDEVLSANQDKNRQSQKARESSPQGNPFAGMDSSNPFAAFGAMGGMPNQPATGKLPLKMRLMAKLSQLATNPKFAQFLQKKWWPLWIVFGLLFSGVLIVIALFFLIYKCIMAVYQSYADLFRK